ncbi:Cytosolic 5'-nucleotidase 3A [Trichoplax sp. H2]|nr:Cytosolic 5'-nucleotidase 3A [Trichoplax sp. H2]|eukprot:RDD39621.1 Cytosolic 5'-nucleotidase 3A [Trichoplax sp. H2]
MKYCFVNNAATDSVMESLTESQWAATSQELEKRIMAETLSAALSNQLRKLLQQSPMHCRVIDGTLAKLKSIAKGGPRKLQFVTDYDRTLTCLEHNGEITSTTFDVIYANPLIDKEIRDKIIATRMQYISTFTSRQGAEELMAFLDRYNIPILIFSAGIGDIILEGFRQRSVFRKNMEVLSNMMKFNDDGLLVGFQGDIIHARNKARASEYHSSYFERIKERDNIILMGDVEGDLQMADGIDYSRNKVTIGFLNGQVDELLDTYMALYDIVIVGDESMESVNQLLLTMFDHAQLPWAHISSNATHLQIRRQLPGNTSKRNHGEQFFRTIIQSAVYCRDVDGTIAKLQMIAKDGTDKFQFITDYDWTLTYRMYKGEIAATSFGVIDSNPLVDKKIRDAAESLRDYYYGIEISDKYTFEEKTAYMATWWKEAEKLMVSANIYRNDLSKLLKVSSIRLREGTDELMATLKRHNIPVLILSAGLGDIIREGFHQQSMFYENMEILSNMMIYSDDGSLIGFQEDVIHSFDKTRASEHNSSYFKKNKERYNLILMGDTEGDLNMADGIDYLRNQVSIGFLNTKVNELLDSYKAKYDIVIAGDQNMDFVNKLLKAIF